MQKIKNNESTFPDNWRELKVVSLDPKALTPIPEDNMLHHKYLHACRYLSAGTRINIIKLINFDMAANALDAHPLKLIEYKQAVIDLSNKLERLQNTSKLETQYIGFDFMINLTVGPDPCVKAPVIHEKF